MITKYHFDHDIRFLFNPSKDLSVVRKVAARGVCITCVWSCVATLPSAAGEELTPRPPQSLVVVKQN